jgi:hypothetical protein
VQVNQLVLTYRWSNITFDSVVLENMAPGDARSAEIARPMSVASAGNFWALYFNRTELRSLVRNVTLLATTMVSDALCIVV